MNDLKEFMNNLSNNNIELSEEDKEYLEYAKKFKDRFGRDPYIAEPYGTKKETIEAIKKCLQEDEDILDSLLTQENKDKFVYQEGDIQISKSQCNGCIYEDKNNNDKCVKYPEGKPNKLITNEYACKHYRKEGQIIL